MAQRFFVLTLAVAVALCAVVLPRDARSDTPARKTALVPVTPHAETGAGQDAGVFLPPLASSKSEIVGTVEGDGSGASTFYVGTVDDKGKFSFWKGVTDELGRFHISVPDMPPGTTGLVLFKHFDKRGRADDGSSTVISDSPGHLPDTQAASNIPATGPAIVESNSAIQRGGTTQGVFQLQTRGTDPATTKITLDRKTDQVDTLGASDRSAIGRVHDDTPLGKHNVGVRSGDQTGNEQPTYVITLHLDKLPPMRPGSVATVRLHVDGLGKAHAQALFNVTGGAQLAEGGTSKTLPVVDGLVALQIRALHTGAFVVKTVVDAQLSEEDQPCKVKVTDGWFEPSQGVWQDDNVFEDHPTKELLRTDKDGPPTYLAELSMIAQRDTRLFGVAHYQRTFKKTKAGTHGVIHMSGTTDCSDAPVAVKMRFTLEGPGSSAQVIHVSDTVASISLTGQRSKNQSNWTADLRSDAGIPPYPRAPFKISSFGEYTIKDELIRASDNSSTGLVVTVSGPVHAIAPLKIGFGSAGVGAGADAKLIEVSSDLAAASAQFIGDYYPLMPGGFTSGVMDSGIDLARTTAASVKYDPGPGPTLRPESQKLRDDYTREQAIQSELARRYDTLARLSGYQRIVLSMHGADLNLMGHPRVAGFTLSQKVVVVLEGQDYLSVADQLAHTFPYLWSSEQMAAKCSAPGDYHGTSGRVAFGVRMLNAGKAAKPAFQERQFSFMGPPMPSSDRWIDQCTYWHLADVLQAAPDPAVILVRGEAFRRGNRLGVLLWPSYTLEGAVDLTQHSAGASDDWSIVLRDSSGQTIGEYPFHVLWADDIGKIRDVVSFSYQVPVQDNVASVEVRGPGGTSASRKVSDAAPKVTFTSPSDGATISGSQVHVTWSVTSAPQTQPLSTVLYSRDSGKTWSPRSFESKGSALDVRLAPKATRHRIKVIVTDGSRSSEATLDLRS